MVLSAACKYTLQAFLVLLRLPDGERMLIRDVAQQTHVSEPFLAKLVQNLVRSGLIQSTKGKGGGICLTEKGRNISLLEIIEYCEGTDWTTGCIIGLKECTAEKPCPLHEFWSPIRDQVVDELGALSLSALEVKLQEVQMENLIINPSMIKAPLTKV